MKNLLNRQLTENQRQEIIGMAEDEDCNVTISSLKKSMIEMFMQVGLVEKQAIDYSKMSTRELRGYALNDNDLTYDNKSRRYVKF